MIERLLARLYGRTRAARVAAELERILTRHRPEPRPGGWSEGDAWLITYPDQFQAPDEPSLRTLRRFFRRHLAPHLGGIHLLPFFPWSSDDGYSILDYLSVDPRYGTWEDIEALAAETRLMVDAVVNHMSVESAWFRRFLSGDARFAGFFRTADPGADLSKTVRPRTHPLLTRFLGADGPIHVWTTFSPDQADLDYRNPTVLVEIVKVILEYARRGASAIRLDAIGFLWKEEGTDSIHLPQTHTIVRLFRACLDRTYPWVLLVTETNVPQPENLTYFGTPDEPEAQVVYQFPLPPIVLHAFATGDGRRLSEWASTITSPLGPGRTYFNFLASHDGVGLRPVEDLLPGTEIDRLIDLTVAAGGAVGCRRLADGTGAPYELDCTWFDLMAVGVGEEAGIARHLASHAIMVALPGIAGVYVHSLFGTANDHAAYAKTGMPRALNRRRFRPVAELEGALADPTRRETRVLAGLRTLLAARRASSAFHPDAGMRVLDIGRSVFAVEREGREEVARVVVNLGGDPMKIPVGESWELLPDRTEMPAEITLPGWGHLFVARRR